MEAGLKVHVEVFVIHLGVAAAQDVTKIYCRSARTAQMDIVNDVIFYTNAVCEGACAHKSSRSLGDFF